MCFCLYGCIRYRFNKTKHVRPKVFCWSPSHFPYSRFTRSLCAPASRALLLLRECVFAQFNSRFGAMFKWIDMAIRKSCESFKRQSGENLRERDTHTHTASLFVTRRWIDISANTITIPKPMQTHRQKNSPSVSNCIRRAQRLEIAEAITFEA